MFFTNAFKRKTALNNERSFFHFALVKVGGELLESHVSTAPKSTKRSCATPTTSEGDVIGQISQCELLIEGDIFPQVVAIEKVYQEGTTLHNIPLSPNIVKVTVEKVRVADVCVPLPSDEVTTSMHFKHS